MDQYSITYLGYQNLDESILKKLDRTKIHRLTKESNCLIMENYSEEKNSLFLKDSILKSMKISNTRIKQGIFINCKFDDTVISESSFANGIFINCYFKYIMFDKVNLEHAKMVYCHFESCSMTRCKLNYSHFFESNFENIEIEKNYNHPRYSETKEMIIENSVVKTDEGIERREVENMNTDKKNNYIENKIFESDYQIESNMIYNHCTFNETNIKKIDVSTDFQNCIFNNASFKGEFYKISFSSSEFNDCIFSGFYSKCFFDGCKFNNENKFEEMSFFRCDFSRVDMPNQIMDIVKEKSPYSIFDVVSDKKELNSEFENMIKPIFEKFQKYKKEIDKLQNKTIEKKDIVDYISNLSSDEKLQIVVSSLAVSSNNTNSNDNEI